MKNYFKYFVKEIIPITVGVLVALLINTCSQNLKDQKYINKIFSAMHKELAEANEDINEILVQQKSLRDTLDFYLEDPEVSVIDITSKTGGIYVPYIKTNAWNAISNSRIELIDYDKISILSSIEVGKAYLKDKSDRLVEFIFSNANETKKEKKEIMKILVSDIIGEEVSVQEDIQKILNE